MAFKDSFHEIVPGYRINGDAVVFVIKGVKTGGVGAGSKMIEVGNIGVASRKFIETSDPESWPVPDSYTPVEDIDKLYEQLELSGLSTVVDGVLANPSNISLLEYDDNQMVADAVGSGGKFTFVRADAFREHACPYDMYIHRHICCLSGNIRVCHVGRFLIRICFVYPGETFARQIFSREMFARITRTLTGIFLVVRAK